MLPNQRVEVIRSVLKGRVEVDEAALLLGLSARSVRRLRERFLEGGPAALRHGKRHAAGARARSPARRTRGGLRPGWVRRAQRQPPAGPARGARGHRALAAVGPLHPALGGMASPRPRRALRFRNRREHRAAEGMLVQLLPRGIAGFGSSSRVPRDQDLLTSVVTKGRPPNATANTARLASSAARARARSCVADPPRRGAGRAPAVPPLDWRAPARRGCHSYRSTERSSRNGQRPLQGLRISGTYAK